MVAWDYSSGAAVWHDESLECSLYSVALEERLGLLAAASDASLRWLSFATMPSSTAS